MDFIRRLKQGTNSNLELSISDLMTKPGKPMEDVSSYTAATVDVEDSMTTLNNSSLDLSNYTTSNVRRGNQSLSGYLNADKKSTERLDDSIPLFLDESSLVEPLEDEGEEESKKQLKKNKANDELDRVGCQEPLFVTPRRTFSSDGFIPKCRRTKPRHQSGCAVSFLQESSQLKDNRSMVERKDSVKLLKDAEHRYYDEEVIVVEQQDNNDTKDDAKESAPTQTGRRRFHRNKPRRQSGPSVMDVESIDTLRKRMELFFDRENSVRLIQKRLPSRRASMSI
jgi:hypothetical protein